MKKTLFTLIGLMAMLLVPTSGWAATVTFTYKYNGVMLTNDECNNQNWDVNFYKKGERIANSSYYYDEETFSSVIAKQVATLDDSYVGETVSYKTATGFTGSITVTDGATFDLNCKKLSFTNLNTWVYIYNSDGNNVASVGYSRTYCFLSPTGSYYYEKDGQRNYIDMSSDKEIDWSEGAPVVTQYSIRVVGHYGDFPVPSGSWYLYKYGNTQNYVASFYAGSTYGNTVDAGNYWLRDDAGKWSDKIELNANKTIYLPYYKVTFVSKTGGVPTTSGNISVRVKPEGDSYSYYSKSADFNSNGEAVFYLQSGTYIYNSNGVEGEITVGTTDQQVNINKYKVTITVQDAKGEKQVNQYVNLNSSGSGTSDYTDENGQVVFEVGSGTYTASLSGGSIRVSKEITVTDANVNETLEIPAIITFYVEEDGKPYDGWFGLSDDEGYGFSGSVEGGVAKFRLEPNKYYNISGGARSGMKVYLTEGCTISLGTIEISSEGMGIAFPCDMYNPSNKVGVLVGSVIRLTAIPVKDDMFQKWVINGVDYTDPMIDFTIKDAITTAKAVFSGTATSRASVKQDMTNVSLRYDDQFVYFSADVEGSVSIYNIDGKLMKTLGVIGDRVGIYDLPQGNYVLTLTTADGAQTARFMKK